MKTLADFKRAMSLGTTVILKERDGKEVNEKRVVGKVQSNSLAFFKSETNKSLSWLEWPKAPLLEFDGKVAKIYEPGKRELTAEEQKIIDGEPRDDEQDRIDMLSDGSTMFYRRKHYYKDSGYNYLFGTEKEKGKRMTWDYKKRMIVDDSVKGKLILVYEFPEAQK